MSIQRRRASTEPEGATTRRFRRALWALFVVLVALLLVLPAPWSVEGGPGFAPPEDRPFAATVQIALFWASGLNALLCLLGLACLRLWTRPLERPPDRPGAPAVSRTFFGLLLLAAALAGALRWPLAHGSLWWDEGWSLTRVVRGTLEPRAEDPRQLEFRPRHWARTVWYWKKPTNHVLYNVSARASLDAWRLATGHAPEDFDDFVFRVPAFTASLAGVFALGLLGWRLGFPAAGVGAAFLLALQPWWIRYSVDGRAYAFVLPLATVSCILLTEALRTGAWRHWLGYGASQFLLLWNHPFHIYLTAGLGAAALLSIGCGPGTRRDRITLALRLLVVNAGAAMLLWQVMAPNLAQALVWDDEASGPGLKWTTAKELWASLAAGLDLRASYAPPGFPSFEARAAVEPWLAPVVFGLLPGLALVGAARLVLASGPTRAVWLGSALVVPVSMAIVHLTGQLYYHRFMVFGLSPLLLALAVGFETLLRALPLPASTRRAVVALGFAIGLGLFQGLVLPQTRLVLTRPIAPLRDVAAFFQSRTADDPLAVTRAGYGLGGGMPKIYDPWIRYVHTRAELEDLCETSRRTGRPLYVFYGQEAQNRNRWPDGFKLLDDEGLFEEVARFEGVEARFYYRIFRYRDAPLPSAERSGAGRLARRDV